MRVLVVAAPLTGHLLPLVPLAVALRALGHEVTIASGGELRSVAGFPVHDIGTRLRLAPLALRLAATHPRLVGPELRGTAGTAAVGPMFGAVNARLVDEVAALAEAVPPDLVVHEPLAVSGAVVAAARRVPAALVAGMLWDGPELVAVTARDRAMVAAAARYGVTELPVPAAVVTTAPRSVVGPREGLLMRPDGVAESGSAPDWVLRPSDRPRLLVSHSTLPGAGAHLRSVVAAADALDAEVVLVRAPEKIVRAGLPANVRAVGWVPMDQALAHATAIVHHGGAGTTLAALAAGVPQLVVAGAGDRRYNARLVAARGAGLATTAAQIDAPLLRTLLSAAPLRAAAVEVAAEIAGLPSPAEVAPVVAAAGARSAC
ncbi:nucleotide disphospho-sugar-binding domain-containing protein [Pseudonocardia sp. CA-107938]|uniref:nucleotide disphospho-sugar-binding domain-containing protein n=1 Tax=Pseudonocardia sp. CA-107938 TaxID=3240021 RepID=UPI003D8C1ED3